jgi:hypothetical protein
MGRYYQALEDYFLFIYEEYPQEIQKKMKNLLFINILNLLGWILLFLLDGFNRYINHFNLITVLRDFIILSLILSVFLLIRLKKPLLAGYITMMEVLALAVHPILMDLFGSYSISEYTIYRTLCFLIIGELLISAYAIKRIQILIYSILSFLLLVIHFWILMEIFYGGSITDDSYAIIFECLFLLTSSTVLSLFLFSLTLRSRMEIINNIVLFKLGKDGPTPFYTEHPISYDELIKTGVYLYTAIGQGNQYRTGLFGPIPFGDEKEKIALIYTSIVNDSEFEDPRLKGKNYLMISLLADEEEINLLNRSKILRFLEEGVEKIDDLDELTEEDIQDFIVSIRTR